MNYQISIMILMLINISLAKGQSVEKQVDLSFALQIGDSFTGSQNIAWMRGNLKTINWKAWDDKVIVLDFFDTYCSTCIQSMPHLQQLQNKYSDRIQILNVTWQDKATLDKFFANNDYLREHEVNLPVIYQDKDLRALFPYQAAPHVAIIYKGRVKAITFSRLLTEENINKLLLNGEVNLPLKNDFGKGSLVNTDALNSPGAWLKGYQQGIRSQPLTFEKDSTNKLNKSSIYNKSIFNALLNTWTPIRKPTALLRAEQIVWKVQDSSIYKNFTNTGEAWDAVHAISYERLDRIKRPDSAQAKIVLHDLHSFLGINSYWSTKSFPCLLLKKGITKKSNKHYEKKMKYQGTDVLAKFMAFDRDFPLISDQVKSLGTLEIGNFSNVEELNEQLMQYGMFLEKGEAEFEIFVIEED